ncbi:MAG: hypothetical protein RL768_2424 [Nitrospirota bacterium]|jgi:plasmid stabilization system protein ParE
MHIRWHPDAQLEAGEAAKFYWERQPGLEQRFLDILEDALHRIRRRPQLYPKIAGNIHKCKLPRFPYGVIYRLTNSDAIEVLAVMHLRREPGYWKTRST